MLMTWIIYYSPHIFSLRSKDHLIRFNDSYPSIKILINAEKHEHHFIIGQKKPIIRSDGRIRLPTSRFLTLFYLFIWRNASCRLFLVSTSLVEVYHPHFFLDGSSFSALTNNIHLSSFGRGYLLSASFFSFKALIFSITSALVLGLQ